MFQPNVEYGTYDRYMGRNRTVQYMSYAGLTRVSINLRKTLSKTMDCRVKPGNDDKDV